MYGKKLPQTKSRCFNKNKKFKNDVKYPTRLKECYKNDDVSKLLLRYDEPRKLVNACFDCGKKRKKHSNEKTIDAKFAVIIVITVFSRNTQTVIKNKICAYSTTQSLSRRELCDALAI